MKAHRLPGQDGDVRYHVQYVAHPRPESGFLHELSLETLSRTLAEPNPPTGQPPCARDPRGRRGPHEKDLVAASRHAVRGLPLAFR